MREMVVPSMARQGSMSEPSRVVVERLAAAVSRWAAPQLRSTMVSRKRGRASARCLPNGRGVKNWDWPRSAALGADRSISSRMAGLILVFFIRRYKKGGREDE